MRVHVTDDFALENINEAVEVFGRLVSQEEAKIDRLTQEEAERRAKRSWFNKDVEKHLKRLKGGDLNDYIERLRIRNQTHWSWAEARLEDAERLLSKFKVAMRMGEPVILDDSDLTLLSVSLGSAKKALHDA